MGHKGPHSQRSHYLGLTDRALSAAILDPASSDGDSSEVYARLKERNIRFMTYSRRDDLVGLKKRLASRQLRGAVDDGSIVQHVSWRAVLPGDVVFVQRHCRLRGLHRRRRPGSTPAGSTNIPHSNKSGPGEWARGNNTMKPLKRVALIGNHLPRRCGIATFTQDLHRSISTARPGLETCVVAMNDPGATYDYPAAVRFQIPEETIDG